MHRNLAIALLLFLNGVTFSQQGWFWLDPPGSWDMVDIYFINENTGFAGTYNNRIIKTTNGGLNWSEYLADGLSVENILFVNENTGYAGLSWGKIAKTTNSGLNWIITKTGFFDHNHGISFPSVDTGYSVTKYGNYLKTINGGASWISLGYSGTNYGDIYFINNTTGFAAGDTSALNFISKGILRSTTNGGLTWHTYYVDSVSYLWDACVSNANTWFAAGYKYMTRNGIIMRSTNFGLSWSHIDFPDELSAIHFPSPLIGYASTTGNIMYKTTNGGDSWFATECIDSNESYGIFFTNENTGYAVGYDGRMIKTTTGGGNFIGIQPISTEVPNTFLLHQNYPNPFNPTTKIKFELPQISFVTLTIYDVLGREVSVLVNEELKSGIYNIDFSGTNLPSGVYFYRLRSEDFTQTRKMVLVK